MSLKDTLLGLKPKIIEVDNAEGVFVRVMTGSQRYTLEKMFEDIKKNGKDALVETTLICACESDGSLVFELGDRQQVSQMPSDVLSNIFKAALKINKMAAEDVTDEVKNSGETTA